MSDEVKVVEVTSDSWLGFKSPDAFLARVMVHGW